MSRLFALWVGLAVAFPAGALAAPNGWIPDVGGGVDAAETEYRPGDSPAGKCAEPAADTQAKSNCKGELSWDEKQCKHVCRDKKGKVLEKKAKKKKAKKAKKKKKKEKYDDSTPHEVGDGVEFSCKNPPAVTESAKSTCPGNLVWNEKACKHVCRAPEVDCSGMSSKKCKKAKKRAKHKFNKDLKNSGKETPKKPKLTLGKGGFKGLR